MAPAPPDYRFSMERREDLERLGVKAAQIAEIEAVLPVCRVLLEKDPRLADTRDELEKLIAALGVMQRIFDAPTKAAKEALNRWMTAAHALHHPFGRDPEFADRLDFGTLRQAARDAKQRLGAEQRRSHAAYPEPIRRIDEALQVGWTMAHAGGARPAYIMPPRVLRQVVHIAYEAMGISTEEGYMPERAWRQYNKRRKSEDVKRAAAREDIACT
jgi:hypothetical protein